MKKLLLTSLLVASVAVFAQESIKFETSTFKDVLAKAKKENKIVFLDAYASWCGPCKMMEKNVFTQPSVQDFYNKTFINSRFDMEKGEGPAIAAKYGISSYPSLLFLNGDGDVVKKAIGYHGEEQFLEVGKDANNPLYRGASLQEKFDKGESDPAFLKNFISLNATTKPDLAQKAADRYFATKKDQALSDEEIYLLLTFTKSAKSQNYGVMQKYRAEILKKIPENTLKQFETSLKLNDLGQETVDIPNKSINEEKFLKGAASFASPEEAKNFLLMLKMNFYPSVGNYDAFAKTALEYYKEPDSANPNELLSAAMLIAENIRDKAILDKAEQWAEKSVMASETPENTYTLAKIYHKTGKNQLAKDFAETSRRLAASQGRNTEKIDLLIKEIATK